MKAGSHERFWAKVEPEPNSGCFLWTGFVSPSGYGIFRERYRGKGTGAHRYAFEATRGPIPNGLNLDHLCRVRSCVNPDHLEPVTHQENVRRGLVSTSAKARHQARAECVHGHPLSLWGQLTASHSAWMCGAGLSNVQRRERPKLEACSTWLTSAPINASW